MVREIEAPDTILVGHGAAMETPEEMPSTCSSTRPGTASGPVRPPSGCPSSAPCSTGQRRRVLQGAAVTRRGRGGLVSRTVVVLATLDTKGEETQYVRNQIGVPRRAGPPDRHRRGRGTADSAGCDARGSGARPGGTPLSALLEDPTREAAAARS